MDSESFWLPRPATTEETPTVGETQLVGLAEGLVRACTTRTAALECTGDGLVGDSGGAKIRIV